MSTGPIASDVQKMLVEFLSNHSVLIVDSVSSARNNLATALTKMGGARQKMSLVGTIAEARKEIQKLKPKLVLSDYMIGAESGLDLLREQRALYTNEELKDATFVLVTSNASQAVVAKAAEEDVDTFIVKPYTHETLISVLGSVIHTKLNPSQYLQLIEEGKTELFQANYEVALQKFEQAIGLHEEPTLACFYAGQTEFLKVALENAEGHYYHGLSFNQIHFKCLEGMYDLLMAQKKFAEAYDVVRRLVQYFPANARRLTTVMRLAVLTENYGDVEGYYHIFLKLTDKPEELLKHLCSALVVSGKHFLQDDKKPQAMAMFEGAVASAGTKTQFAVYVIEALVNYNLKSDAEAFFTKLKAHATSGQDFMVANFLMSTLESEIKKSVDLGQDLLKQGIATAVVYEKLIYQTTRSKQIELALRLFDEACQRYPDRADDFQKVMEVAKSKTK